MKRTIIFGLVFILFASSAYSQKIALLKSDFKSPIIFTDSVTLNQISQNYIPVEANCFDSVFTILKFLKNFLEERDVARAKMQSFELKVGVTLFKVSTFKHAYGDCYDIEIVTKINDVISRYKLVDNIKLMKKNIKKVEELMKYMSTEKSLFKNGYKEMSIRLLNIEVYE